MKNKNNNNQQSPSNEITRKEALKKGSQYAAFTAASMLMVLSPRESQAQSPTTNRSPSRPSREDW